MFFMRHTPQTSAAHASRACGRFLALARSSYLRQAEHVYFQWISPLFAENDQH